MRPLAIVGLLVFIAFVVLGQAVGGPPGRSKPLPLPPGELELRVFDVGQGDAILLRFGARALLVDAGPDPQTARQVLLPRLARLGVDRLDGLALTHADADHIGGAADILGALPVTTLWMSEPEQDHPLLSVIEAAAARAGSRIERPRDGEALQWHPAVSIHVRFAAPDVAGSDNNQSMVVQVRYGDADFLLTGDIERAAERALVSANGGLEADVLKVAHHGASTSSSPEFLACREAPKWRSSPQGWGTPSTTRATMCCAACARSMRRYSEPIWQAMWRCAPMAVRSPSRWNAHSSGGGDGCHSSGNEQRADHTFAPQRLAEKQHAEGGADHDAEFAGG